MVELIQGALAARGIEDEGLAVGQFNPRGHTGAMFAGGLVAGEAGSLLVDAGESAAVGAGSLAGMYAADARSGLPAKMLVAATATAVYGFAAPTRHDEPTALVFPVTWDRQRTSPAAGPPRRCRWRACGQSRGRRPARYAACGAA